MKTLFYITFVVCIFLSVFLIGANTSFGKNIVGSFLGYGDCPNCHDSWYWKKDGSINYGPMETPKNFKSDGIVLSVKIGYGVMICKECLSKPKTLNTDVIRQSLIKSTWNKEDINNAIIAINAYKANR